MTRGFIYIIIFISALLHTSLTAQCQELSRNKKDIVFENSITWDQLKQKAASDRKYIFVDCFATWCGPCKKMEKEVFTNDTVANLVNKKFVSLRLQMDTTVKDSDQVKMWYAVASDFQKQYNITSLPTYLFFSSDGEIVHKGVGFKSVKNFVDVVKDAQNATTQFYTLQRSFYNGLLSPVRVRELAITASMFKEMEFSLQLARSYMDGYLSVLTLDSFFKKENLEFLGTFYKTITESDRAFNLYRDQKDKVDSVMGRQGYAERMRYLIIWNNSVRPVIEMAKISGKEPEWTALERKIEAKYGKGVASLHLVDAKVRWYKDKLRYKEYCNFLFQQAVLVTKIDDPRTKDFIFLNGVAWDLFRYSSRKKHLRMALSLAEQGIELSPERIRTAIMDTRANLLYKLGRTKEAIREMEILISLATGRNDGYIQTMEKMKNGLPTWK